MIETKEEYKSFLNRLLRSSTINELEMIDVSLGHIYRAGFLTSNQTSILGARIMEKMTLINIK